MNYKVIGKNGNSPRIAILCPTIEYSKIDKHYFNPYLKSLNQNILICDLYIDKTKKKTSAKDMKEYLNDLLPELINIGITLIIVTQPEYFKIITKQSKTDSTIGDIEESVLGVKLHVTYCPNYSRVFYDPIKIESKIQLSLQSVINWSKGNLSVIGKNIIKYAAYPKTNSEIREWLDKLLKMECDLTVDIEAFSLKHYNSGIGTITFCWSDSEGIAFPVDYFECSDTKPYAVCASNSDVRLALKQFFIKFKHKAIYHNICYDVYILTYQLFMDHILDQSGLLKGLRILLRNWDCSQLITYLATNSCAGNELNLKAQAQEYAGNYAQENVKDITLIPKDKLLEYNLIDGLSTWYTYNKNLPIMVKDSQETIYNTIFKPAVIDVIQMQLTGLPINMSKVKVLNLKLQKESDICLDNINNLNIVSSFLTTLKQEYVINKNLQYKKKRITIKDVSKDKIFFNPNSPLQLQKLLFSEDFLGLPILDYTGTKLPATGADTLEKLKHKTKDEEILKLLDLLIEYKASAIILSTFLPAFLQAQKGIDEWHYLFGNFKLGGTASGRLSSNNPNLQNIPSSGSSKVKQKLAKMIKECFEAPPGWLFVGIDFDSLEDKISAVTTKDPEKIKVYSDKYDGHCLRALAYFPEKMPDIELCSIQNQSYKATIKGKPVYFHSKEIIDYHKEKITGEELYNKLKISD